MLKPVCQKLVMRPNLPKVNRGRHAGLCEALYFLQINQTFRAQWVQLQIELSSMEHQRDGVRKRGRGKLLFGSCKHFCVVHLYLTNY